MEKPKTIHVTPVNDLYKHESKERPLHATCICGPKVEKFDNGNIVVVHNSFDGRELWEEAAEV